MKSVILAAGGGTRMEPLTETTPKPLLPVANTPIIEHIINSLKTSGLKEILIVVEPKSKIISYLGDGKKLGVKINYVVQKEKLGTANALSLCENFLDSDFVLINGDNLVRAELLKELQKKHNSALTMCLLEVSDPTGLGSVAVEGNKVTKILEKPKPGEALSDLASIGTYAFSTEIFDAIKKVKKSFRGEFELPDAMNTLLDEGKKVSYIKAKFWQHLSYPWDLLRLNKMILDEIKPRILGTVEKNVTLKGKVWLGKNSLIKSSAYIEGPVMIGENCTIGPNCFLRSYTTIGNDIKVGNGVEIKNTILFGNTNVPHLSYLGDSIVGYNCNFGAGAILTNFRLDGENIKVSVKGEQIDTGLKKFGAVIGDNVKVGSNVVVNPGRKIGSNSKIWPMKVVYNDIEPNTEFK